MAGGTFGWSKNRLGVATGNGDFEISPTRRELKHWP